MSASIISLLALAFVLGLKHGMDADHLATIDGLTRYNSAAGRLRLSRCCGLLFSLGHGLVVCAVATACALWFSSVHWPAWLESFGLWISVSFLLVLGALNLHAAFTCAHAVPTGLRARLFPRLQRNGHPLSIIVIGGIFAISFDTLSQATLFSAAATSSQQWLLALAAGLCFCAGMTTTDGLNSLWLSHLLRRSCNRSRILTFTIAWLSLSIAALNLARHYLTQVAHWLDGRELQLGLLMIGVIAMSYWLTLSRVPRGASSKIT